jgi:hypothetical protein
VARYGPNRYDVAYVDQSDGAALTAAKLNKDLYLHVYQDIEVDEDGHCMIRSYRYRLQQTPEPESWIVRWEFTRAKPKPTYRYVHSHLHVNARTSSGGDIARFHLPTDRVPLELVLWHLITEWGVEPLGKEWDSILVDSVKGFYERRTHDDPAIALFER